MTAPSSRALGAAASDAIGYMGDTAVAELHAVLAECDRTLSSLSYVGACRVAAVHICAGRLPEAACRVILVAKGVSIGLKTARAAELFNFALSVARGTSQ